MLFCVAIHLSFVVVSGSRLGWACAHWIVPPHVPIGPAAAPWHVSPWQHMEESPQCSPTFWSVPPWPSSQALHGVMQEVQVGKAVAHESDGSPAAPVWFFASASDVAQ